MAKALKKTRSSIKGQLTSILTYVNKNPVDDDLENINIRLKRAHELMNSFTVTEDKLFAYDDENIESEIDEFSEKYYTVVAGLNKLIRESQVDNTAQASNAFRLHSTLADAPASFEVKLPDIQIPKFSGDDITKWQPFFQLFSSAIHTSQKLDGTKKFFYLKSFLSGEASGLIDHLALTEENYGQALKILKDRYGRRRHVINDYIKKFLAQPVVTSANTINIRKLLNTSEQITKGLDALGNGADHRDHWLIFILLSKLDDDSKKQWALESATKDSPTLDEFFKFLLTRSDCLESICSSSKSQSQRSSKSNFQIHSKPSTSKSFVTSTSSQAENSSCVYCNNGSHNLYECSALKSLPIEKRRDFIKDDRRCFNCLGKSHSVYHCKSKSRCQKCGRKHHTLVHGLPSEADNPPTSSKASEEPSCSKLQPSTNLYCESTQPQALLPTAIIKVQNKFGEFVKGRALLDSCSVSSFITESFAQSLQLSRKKARLTVTGLGKSDVGCSNGIVTVTLDANENHPPFIFNALVMPKITSKVPSSIVNISNWNHIKDIQLADPKFNIPGEVDMLIGVELFFDVLRTGYRRGDISQPAAQNTVFGWVIGGNCDQEQTNIVAHTNSEIFEVDVDKSLRRFWEIESIPERSKLSAIENLCEELFVQSIRFNDDGRPEVKLPFVVDDNELGESKYMATNRLRAVERRFAKDPQYCALYKSFMTEYEDLGHMIEVPERKIASCKFFLPHHGVLKESSTTTKLRVVFDGSAKTTNGKSLNDVLLVGPTVQSTLYDILVRFRRHRFVFTADAEKMYRQILIAPEDRPYQCIVWRRNVHEPIKYFELQTVTYGTSSAPFLATRSIVEIANRHASSHPVAASVIKNDMYVDDLMSGADTLQETLKLKTEVNHILSKSGFQLRKWVSNSSQIVPNTESSTPKEISEHLESENVKILGLNWNPTDDCFSFKVRLDSEFIPTKRKLLSESSRVFDPLGWLSPTTISIKILFQNLWLQKLDWDDVLPADESKKWKKLRESLHHLEKCQIPRWLHTQSDVHVEIHGFCDASQNAYAAAVYSRVETAEGYLTTLIAAKTKVAPVKQLSIPRLELCGAVLLVKLITSVVPALKMPISNTRLWTDSKIVLDWLSVPSRKLNTFVANRTAEIIDNYPRSYWSHVSSEENPADCASRGLSPSELPTFDLWWSGPTFLSQDEANWKVQSSSYGTCEEEKLVIPVLFTIPNQSIIQEIVEKKNSFDQMVRILAFVRRFIHNKVLVHSKRHKIDLFCSSYITRKELEEAEHRILIHEQSKHFSQQLLKKDSCLRSLNAFSDDTGIIRVGGRIDNSTEVFQVKHPIIIPYQSHIASSIVRDYHIQNKHAGFTLLSSILKQKYWLVKSKVVIRNTLRKCIPCFRQNPKCETQLMGNLPLARLEYERPFLKVGVDYAGPLLAYFKRSRGQKPHKVYICLFVCMATKAVHIEVAFALTTDSFLAAFRRFFSRRGVCSDIFSDNGTNFVGANNQLTELFQFLLANNQEISHSLLTDKVIWHFNPPGGSHFGGIFETAIKSTKIHLKRVIGDHILTYEELLTLLIQIEAILNSRPICAQSAETLDPLTPFHFILGQVPTQIPTDMQIAETETSRLSHWQQIERMRQHFWKRFHSEYLTSLHQRNKWIEQRKNIKLNDIVVIRDENIPPASWKMAKVIAVHPGNDNIVRVVTLKTHNGTMRRPIHKLCILPLNQEI